MTTQNFESFTPPEDHNQTTAPGQEPTMRQSRLGIASFVIGLVSIAGFIVCMIFFTMSIMNYVTKDGKFIANPEAFVGNASIILPLLMMFASICASFVGLILGIVGACMKNTRKAFSAVGIVLNALLVLGFVGLFAFGLILQSAV